MPAPPQGVPWRGEQENDMDWMDATAQTVGVKGAKAVQAVRVPDDPLRGMLAELMVVEMLAEELEVVTGTAAHRWRLLARSRFERGVMQVGAPVHPPARVGAFAVGLAQGGSIAVTTPTMARGLYFLMAAGDGSAAHEWSQSKARLAMVAGDRFGLVEGYRLLVHACLREGRMPWRGNEHALPVAHVPRAVRATAGAVYDATKLAREDRQHGAVLLTGARARAREEMQAQADDAAALAHMAAVENARMKGRAEPLFKPARIVSRVQVERHPLVQKAAMEYAALKENHGRHSQQAQAVLASMRGHAVSLTGVFTPEATGALKARPDPTWGAYKIPLVGPTGFLMQREQVLRYLTETHDPLSRPYGRSPRGFVMHDLHVGALIKLLAQALEPVIGASRAFRTACGVVRVLPADMFKAHVTKYDDAMCGALVDFASASKRVWEVTHPDNVEELAVAHSPEPCAPLAVWPQ